MSATFDPFGNADLDTLDSVEDAVDRALRVAIRIPDDAVRHLLKAIEKTGAGADLERWEAEEQKSLGGRPKPFSATTALVVLLLAAWVHGRVNDTTICEVLYRQISDEMRKLLGVRIGNCGRHEAAPDYYRRLNHRFNSLLNPIDPSLAEELGGPEEGPAKPQAQPDQGGDRRAYGSARQRGAPDLYASYMYMPRSLRRKWKGGLAIDGTPIRQFTRGVKKDSKWAPCDLDCGLRTGGRGQPHPAWEGRGPASDRQGGDRREPCPRREGADAQLQEDLLRNGGLPGHHVR